MTTPAVGNRRYDRPAMALTLIGATWSAVGSLDGGEISHKLNREAMLPVDAPAIHARLAEVFAWGWAVSAP